MSMREQPAPPPGLPSERPPPRSRVPLYLAVFVLLALGALYVTGFWYLRNPQWISSPSFDAPAADAVRLEAHVRQLTAIEPARNIANPASLDRAATYISLAFVDAGCVVWEQVYEVEQREYRNVICSFGAQAAPRLVLGAHYDVDGEDNPGADDNASGVSAILEVAHLIGEAPPALEHRIDLVAFTLEERPSFRTGNMGSQHYAQSVADDGAELKLMISVEMIGYYSDEPGSQRYPLSVFGYSPLTLFYPSRANFIGVIGRAEDREIVARTKRLMTVSDTLPVYSINAPQLVPGIDRSDHRSFWSLGMPAVMVTDTADYRNDNYHRSSDTPDTLDYERMARVAEGLYRIAVEY